LNEETKEPIIENKKVSSYEFNSYAGFGIYSANYDIFSDYSSDEIKEILANPIVNNRQIRRLSRLVYNTNPIVSNAVDYIVSLPCLSHITTCDGKNKFKSKNNKQKAEDILRFIRDKDIIRDFLFRDCLDGACYYYFETVKSMPDKTKFVADYDMESLYEINTSDINISIIPLPVDWVKIKGYKNNRPVIAFNLEYFDNFDGEKIENKLKRYPAEIRNAYYTYKNGKAIGNWVVLNNDKTIVHKIKSDKREPYGRPITISALVDIFYSDYLTTTKRSVLSEVNNKIIYQTLPEGEKGKCALTKNQQEEQHSTVKGAVMTKNNRGGTSFFTVAAGTKIDTINTSVDVLNEEIEPKLNSRIAMGLGYALGLLDGESGNYSSQQISLELLFSKVYTWVSEIAEEFTYVINKNIIKDKHNEISIYYLPTSLVNKDRFVGMTKELYMAGSGSKSAWISATGWDVNAYLSLMDMENAEKWDEKYLPHLTSYTSSDRADDINPNGNLGGRPLEDNPTNDSTLVSHGNDTNNQPKPSTK
jgi:hypothetical protein